MYKKEPTYGWKRTTTYGRYCVLFRLNIEQSCRCRTMNKILDYEGEDNQIDDDNSADDDDDEDDDVHDSLCR